MNGIANQIARLVIVHQLLSTKIKYILWLENKAVPGVLSSWCIDLVTVNISQRIYFFISNYVVQVTYVPSIYDCIFPWTSCEYKAWVALFSLCCKQHSFERRYFGTEYHNWNNSCVLPEHLLITELWET